MSVHKFKQLLVVLVISPLMMILLGAQIANARLTAPSSFINGDHEKCFMTYEAFAGSNDQSEQNLKLLFDRNPPNCSAYLFNPKTGHSEEIVKENEERSHNLAEFKTVLKERANAGDMASQTYYIQACFDGRVGFSYAETAEQEEARTKAIEWRTTNPAVQKLLDRAITAQNGRLGIWPKNASDFNQYKSK